MQQMKYFTGTTTNKSYEYYLSHKHLNLAKNLI